MEKMDGMEGLVGDKGEDWKMRLRRRVPPRRDPKLYELEDYVRAKKSVRKVRQKA
jgi:hypothetical protein